MTSPIKIILLSLLSFFSIFGFIITFIVIFPVYVLAFKKKSSPIYVIALSNLIMDCCQLIVSISYTLPTNLLETWIFEDEQKSSEIAWLSFVFLFTWNTISSTQIFTAINRLIVVCYPKYNKFTYKVVCYAVVLQYIFNAFITYLAQIGLPCCTLTLDPDYYSYSYLLIDNIKNYADIYITFPYCLITSLICAFSYTYLFIYVRNLRKHTRLSEAEHQRRSSREYLYGIQFCAISAFYFIAWGLFRILPVIVLSNNSSLYWLMVIPLCATINSCATSFVYISANREAFILMRNDEITQQISEYHDKTVTASVAISNEDDQTQKLPGAIASRAQPDDFFVKILREERPDLSFDAKAFTKEDIEQYYNYYAERAEVKEKDVIYSDTDHNIKGSFIKYEVLLRYNEGRYSGAYLVQKRSSESRHKKLFMMKLGLRRNGQRQKQSLLREIKVLKELSATKVANNFPTLIDTGRVCDMDFIVLSLYDMNLDKLRESLGGVFSAPTALNLAYQCLCCIIELHTQGYVHRDIKPTNFCIGLHPNNAKVYLIDFGETIKVGKNIRVGTPDYLTMPYYSLGCHKNKVTAEYFDYESWYYLLLDFLRAKPMNWKYLTNEEQVIDKKENFWKDVETRSSEKFLMIIAKIVLKLQLKYSKDEIKNIKEMLNQKYKNISGFYTFFDKISVFNGFSEENTHQSGCQEQLAKPQDRSEYQQKLKKKK